jgi:hypothetical protein
MTMTRAPVGPSRWLLLLPRIAMQNQRRPEATEWKESAICTKSWNNSVLQFIRVSDLTDPDAGFLQRRVRTPPCLLSLTAELNPPADSCFR